ncbi:MAG: GerMN domain-containing protein [Candidatus Magasanikbacteria bacterium]
MNKTNTLLIILIIVVLGVFGILAARIFSPEDSWICEETGWVKHGNPSNPMPTTGCGQNETTTTNGNTQPYTNEIVVDTPKINDEITSPLSITGKARGSWYFEGSFPIELLNDKGDKLTTAIATAQGEWMTTEFVPFTATLAFEPGDATSGMLIVKNDNPSGDPSKDKQIAIPVQFKQETMTVKIFFNNDKNDPNLSDCSKVYSVERTIPKTQAVGRAALEQLFKGLSKEEAYEGFFDNIPAGVKIQNLTIENGVAKVDLSKELEEGVGGSCRVTAIRAQVTETLKQFPTVKEVIISIDGRTEDILQP